MLAFASLADEVLEGETLAVDMYLLKQAQTLRVESTRVLRRLFGLSQATKVAG